MDNKSSTNLDDHSIQVLEWYEAVRNRPKMWIGSTDSRAIHQLVWELLYNCFDEMEAGYCSYIAVSLNSDGSLTVEDNGRGIPTSVNENSGKTGIELLFTTLGCPTGFELAVVNALCKTLEVEVFREGKAYRQVFHRGESQRPLECVAETDKHGTRVTIIPDPEIFHDNEETEEASPASFDFDILATRLRELAFLNKGLRIDFTDGRSERQLTFKYDNGIADYLEWLNEKHMTVNGPPVYYAAEREHSCGDHPPSYWRDRTVIVECALQWTDREEELSYDFANCDSNVGEFSLSRMHGTIAKVFNEYARASHLLSEHDCDISEAELSRGLCSIVSMKTETFLRWLDKDDLRNIVNIVTLDCLSQYLQLNPDSARSIIEPVLKRRTARTDTKY